MVGTGHQQCRRFGFKPAVVATVHYAAHDVHFLQQHGQRFGSVVRGVAFALGFGVGLECGLQLIGNADVIHHQAARLVLEHAVHPGNRLHQIVAFHGFVHIHGVTARRIKAGQPHVAHDYQL